MRGEEEIEEMKRNKKERETHGMEEIVNVLTHCVLCWLFVRTHTMV